MIIAERLLEWRGVQGPRPIHVKIFSPQRTKQVWTCKYVIDWPDEENEKTASGLDAVQALMTALQMIGSEIYTSNHQKAGGVTFAGSQGCGFSRPANASASSYAGGREISLADSIRALDKL